MTDDFIPAAWVRGPHLQTIVPTLWPAGDALSGSVALDVDVAPGSTIRTLVTRPPQTEVGTIVLVHGLGGSAQGRYMIRTGRAALARGFAVVRVNLRTCGGTASLSRTLYNAGQSEDLGRVLEAIERQAFPRPYAVVGFSLGGNLALRYAGIEGAGARADAFVGVNPPVDLTSCIEALERPSNRLYHLYFRAQLLSHLREVRRVREVAGPEARWSVVRGVREFDELFTAPDAGYHGAAEYYRVASAGPTLSGVRRPSLVLSAADDPFVPVGMFEAWREASPHLRFSHPRTGGHCGYWGRGRPHFWAAGAALSFLDSLGIPARPGQRDIPEPPP